LSELLLFLLLAKKFAKNGYIGEVYGGYICHFCPYGKVGVV
jgi:hypothetical protein